MKKLIYSLIAFMVLASCTAPTETVAPQEVNESEVVEKVIMARRSIRKYTDQSISQDTLNQIIKCAIHAPSGMNKQSYEVKIINNPTLLKEISDAVVKDNPKMGERDGFQTIFYGAPCVAFIANDTTYDCSQIDCGLLGQNMVLSAYSLGIGSCIMAMPVRFMKESPSCAPYMEKLGFSENYNFLYCIALGFPDEAPDAKPRKEDKVQYVD